MIAIRTERSMINVKAQIGSEACPPRDVVHWAPPTMRDFDAWRATPGAARTATRFVGIANWSKLDQGCRGSNIREAEGDQVPSGLQRGEIAALAKADCQTMALTRIKEQLPAARVQTTCNETYHVIPSCCKHLLGYPD